MIITLTDEVGEEMFVKLAQAISDLDKDDILTIYLTSDGGQVMWESAISDMVEQHRERISLIAFGIIQSAAFDLFFKAKCERRILHGTCGLCHTATMPLPINYTGRPADEYAQCSINWFLKESKQASEALVQTLGLSAKEMKLYKSGKDVILSPSRMQEILDHQSHQNKI